MRRALKGLLTAALLPAAAAAQTTRGWELCFTSGVLSCTQLELTTTPVLVGSVRTGTLFDVALRYVERDPWRSALQDVVLAFIPDAADLAAQGPASLVALDPAGGAASPGTSWAQLASSSPNDPTASQLVLTSHAALYGFSGTPQFVGGCGVAADGGVIDAATATSLWTCAPGAVYRTSFAALVTLDADRVSAVSVDAYRAYPGDGAPLAPFCVAQTDGSGSIGTATGDFTDFGDVCTVRPLAPTAVPEPSTVALLAAGLLLLPIVLRPRRTAPRKP